MTAADKASSVYEVAADWCLRLEEGEMALEEHLALEAWLTNAENAQAFSVVGRLWQNAPKIADEPQLIDVRADALNSMRAANSRRWKLAFGWTSLLTAAACIMLVITATLYAIHSRPVLYETSVGERRVVMLDDGSRVSLDAATRLEVNYSDQRRSLHLVAGRAKFDVAKDPRRPFTVSAGGRMVVATGTAFSVELAQKQLRVLLYEGNVAVLDDGPADQPPRRVALVDKRMAPADQQLKPGMVMIAALDSLFARVEPVDPHRSVGWEGGQLSFDDEPLSLAVERLNRYSNRRIRIADQQTGRLLISGAFNAGDTEGFVDGIHAIYPIAVHDDGRDIVIQQK